MATSTPAPRVLLVILDQWPRALLRAALREAGYDAAGTRALGGALRLAEPEAGRGPVGLIVIGQDAFTPAERPDLERLRRTTGAPTLLIASAGREVEEEPGIQVIRRPVSIGELVRTIERLVPLRPDARHPID
jgi:hypothetical protein